MTSDTPAPDLPQSADGWLPTVYDELRRLARQQLSCESHPQTLDATALVHEAYLRLGVEQQFTNPGHFFAAAAEAMRRILIEKARTKGRRRHSAELHRTVLQQKADTLADDDLLALDDAISRLAVEDADGAELVKLCLYAGLSTEEAGQARGISRATAFREMAYAKAWLGATLAEA